MLAGIGRFRHGPTIASTLLLMSVLGILAGALSGAAVLAFRFTLEVPFARWLGYLPDDFESLSLSWRFITPVLGGLFLGLIFQGLPINLRRTGVSYVIERFNLHEGRLSFRSFLVQFFGATASLMSGHSMGREGPAVHLGAAASSVLGDWARLTQENRRILIGCGCAAAIGASFNTPLAGVVFAMEVIMQTYSVSTITPIILASIAGTALTHVIYGDTPTFVVASVNLYSLRELPYLIYFGLITGSWAAAFVFMTEKSYLLLQRFSLRARFLMAGCITALCGMFAPQVLGIGYDTINQALAGQLTLHVLMAICGLKLVATSACVAAGLPGGMIGPSLVMGAMMGGILHLIGTPFIDVSDANSSLYVMLGMAAMMSATIQAPMAGLVALLELTANPGVIFPGMLVVVIASLVSSTLFKRQGIFKSLLDAQGVTLQNAK